MDLKNIPNIWITNDKGFSTQMKFIIVEIGGHFFMAAEKRPTLHERIRQNLHKKLSELGFKGEYGVHGGGRMGCSYICIFLSETSKKFKEFNPFVAEEIIHRDFPGKNVESRCGLPRYSLEKPMIFKVT